MSLKKAAFAAVVTGLSLVACQSGKPRVTSPESQPAPAPIPAASPVAGPASIFSPVPSPVPANPPEVNDPALYLRPRIVAGDALEPGEIPEGPAERDLVVAQGNEIVFKNVITLRRRGSDTDSSKEPRLFLVWSDGAYGIHMNFASFSLKKRDAFGVETGEVQSLEASWNKDRKIYYIPLDTLVVGQNIANADPVDVQWVSLNLNLANNSHFEVKIGLRIFTPIPSPQTQVVQTGDPRAPGESFVGYSRRFRNGLIALVETVTNPTQRPMRLWVRGNGAVNALIALRGMVYEAQAGAPPIAKEAFRRVKFDFDTTTVEFHNGVGYSGERTVTGSRTWASADLPAGHTLKLIWRVKALNARTCNFPDMSPRSLTWDTRRTVTRRSGRGMDVDVWDEEIVDRHSQEVQDSWGLTLAMTEGHLTRTHLVTDLWVSNPFQPIGILGPGIESGRFGVPISDAKTSMYYLPEGSGGYDPGWIPHDCQGVF